MIYQKPEKTAMRYLSVPEAIQTVQAGKMLLICDDEGRENEADLCLAAQFANPEAINFLLHEACGLICVAMSGELLDTLQLPLINHEGEPLQGTAFTVPVDARHGTTTGISASDRAHTIRTLVDPTSRPEDLARPGHVFPLRARAGGTLERRGHTEASVDLMKLAGLTAGAVICEVLDAEGNAARGEVLHEMAQRWEIGVISVEAIARFRREHRVSRIAQTRLPLPEGEFTTLAYQEIATGEQYVALTLGDIEGPQKTPLLVRLHSACATGDIFGSQRCDCQAQLHASLKAIAAEGRGILLYLPHEGRGIGLAGKLQAYALQDHGLDTIEANEQLGYPIDARNYACAIEILQDLHIQHVRLLTNSPRKIQALTAAGIKVERAPLEIPPTADNIRYLQTKSRRMGHLLGTQAIKQSSPEHSTLA
ncbi:riboflavin biosynthesis protein RibBA [Dictyobacter alpinus]|uniref:GTP cyclohydrolase-2 n=1 Tax=Dictyobacter alpinus TaxID=2014873 RepID=A0A402BBA8_9CHLR|nr:GTP cyclohydrolase II [Dictyobacter alpinus]GCE28635.1 riboflavin biosynthesis protein RibBA [Dictyobacter alpinus]